MKTGWMAYNPRQIQDSAHGWFAMCLLEAPTGETHWEYQFGTGSLAATVALGNLVDFKYGCTITQARVPLV